MGSRPIDRGSREAPGIFPAALVSPFCHAIEVSTTVQVTGLNTLSMAERGLEPPDHLPSCNRPLRSPVSYSTSPSRTSVSLRPAAASPLRRSRPLPGHRRPRGPLHPVHLLGRAQLPRNGEHTGPGGGSTHMSFEFSISVLSDPDSGYPCKYRTLFLDPRLKLRPPPPHSLLADWGPRGFPRHDAQKQGSQHASSAPRTGPGSRSRASATPP